MQQRPPPRDRIIRPQPEPRSMPQNEPRDDGLEDLTQDELNDWLTQKVIQLERELLNQRDSNPTPIQPNYAPKAPLVYRTQGQQQPAPPQRAKQPYEEKYSTDNEPPKKKKRSLGSTIALFIGLILVAILLVNIIAIVLFNYQLPF
jgi:hypothetical protein